MDLQVREEDDLFIYTTMMQISMMNFFLNEMEGQNNQEIVNFNYVKCKIEQLYQRFLIGIENDLMEN